MKRRRHNAGFSLVELMVAILILGVALVGLTRGITTALSSNKESELQTAASLIAAGQIETLRSEKDMLIDGMTEGDCGEDLPLYQWTQTITAGSIDGLHDVTVAVQNVNSGETVYELTTELFDPDYPGQDEGNSRLQAGRPAKHRKGVGAE